MAALTFSVVFLTAILLLVLGETSVEIRHRDSRVLLQAGVKPDTVRFVQEAKGGKGGKRGKGSSGTTMQSAIKLGQHGGWIFYKVATSDTSDAGVKAACKGAGLIVPCAGSSGCHFNSKKCTVTSETGCGNPMNKTRQALCGSSVLPNKCAALDRVYAYMGNKWTSEDAACGCLFDGACCDKGSASKGGFAFCAKEANSIGATSSSGGCVFFQACGQPSSVVTCEYKLPSSDSWSSLSTSYSAGKWSCSCWAAGNTQYQQRITVDGVAVITDENAALAIGAPSC